jgi:UDP-N-acetylmuramoyl-L-alanyl-D-glutamate--2,6-diaminopimelate ligase
MKLVDLLDQHPHQLVRGTLDIEIQAGVTSDTRRVERGSLFVAVAGRRQDGHTLLRQAFDKGAVAALVAGSVNGAPEEMTIVRVPDTLAAASYAAARWQGEPGRSMKVVSITGTNGKTSIAAILESILSSLSPAPVGVIGTGGPRIGHEPLPLPVSTPTTPQAIELQAILRTLADRHTETVVMEASSIALVQHRIDHAFTDIGVFTNLSHDHLDDHDGSMDAYRQAKMLLFSGLAGLAVANADDPATAEIHTLMPGRVTTFGIEHDADYRATDIRISTAGTTFTLLHKEQQHAAAIPLPGGFAVSNTLAAIAVCQLLGYAIDRILPELKVIEQIPGRMQTLSLSDGTTVIIDYAHSPDSLEKVLDTLRGLTMNGRLITVFGCGGDRDPAKRIRMGAIAGTLSDHVVITSDNPRTEDPESILDTIEQGLAPTGTAYDRLTDRREAIAHALSTAQPGDTVLIAGKGSEDYQIIGDRTLPFQDTAVVHELTEGLGATDTSPTKSAPATP